ncbi:FAD binding domain-containing protein [Aspergillus nomiae NRRL 13137]|uniref:FAD binding domain-containing protein n=1 Tax=Aspergillus nomiae NRRL (strain ATCC 15546 / NRRL 13137 / CBS 260.88 / M93) TaxID=1509407 RepID=A0A0L1ISM6_ASPN3|nr:FAD binding domain-containing protein [Aspergillus nomiae NRRL 13137]KNG82581.1 FAD binding domain-containing protein [Aspergillus nomiae NRRL 13137]
MRMQVATAVAAWAVTSACQSLPITRNLWSRDADYKDLSEKLSVSAKVYYPGSDEFEQASIRWSNLEKPTVNIVVVPGTENDVVETVQFANKKQLPFLAYNAAHGAITTLGKMDRGIEIYLDQLSGVDIAEDGKTVTIAGGTKSKLVTDTLWDAGKQTVTGACECVSYLGPALGGGHGWLQGRHGLIADQFESMNIVLANGTLVTLDSSSELWWAIKGAGHNFGIVTSVTSKIYDVEYRDWAIEIITFSGDKVEEIYEAVNTHLLKDGNQPTDVINWSYWVNDPAADATNPVIQVIIIQEGVQAVDTVYTAPFHSMDPISIEPHSGSYTDLAEWVGVTTTSGPCEKNGAMNPRFPSYLETYNATAQKQAYEVFAEAVRGSSIFNGSLVTFDGYSTQGVKSIAADSTAVPYRDQNILVGPLIAYMPGDAALDEKAAQVGNQIRQILHEGSGREHVLAYVNYAYGTEGPEEWYGSEEWRQSRLQSLKKKYDPNGMFSFYAPIV